MEKVDTLLNISRDGITAIVEYHEEAEWYGVTFIDEETNAEVTEALDGFGLCKFTAWDNRLNTEEEKANPRLMRVMDEFDGSDSELCTTVAKEALEVVDKHVSDNQEDNN